MFDNCPAPKTESRSYLECLVPEAEVHASSSKLVCQTQMTLADSVGAKTDTVVKPK